MSQPGSLLATNCKSQLLSRHEVSTMRQGVVSKWLAYVLVLYDPLRVGTTFMVRFKNHTNILAYESLNVSWTDFDNSWFWDSWFDMATFYPKPWTNASRFWIGVYRVVFTMVDGPYLVNVFIHLVCKTIHFRIQTA